MREKNISYEIAIKKFSLVQFLLLTEIKKIKYFILRTN